MRSSPIVPLRSRKRKWTTRNGSSPPGRCRAPTSCAPQTKLADQRVQDLGAHNAVALAQTALDNALGVPLGDLHQPMDPLEAGAPDVALDALLTAAGTNRRDIAAAQAAVDAAGYALKEARAARAPRIGVAVAGGNVQPAIVPGLSESIFGRPQRGVDAVRRRNDRRAERRGSSRNRPGNEGSAHPSFVYRSLSAFVITLTDDMAIAAAPMIGESKMPNAG